MAIQRNEVENVAKLARIEMTDAEIDAMTGQLGAILEYIEQLREVDTDGVPPMITAMTDGNVFREDVLKESFSAEHALLNAPAKDANMFEVPQIIDDGSGGA